MDEITKYGRFVELERIAYTDAMTGCKNKNWLLENQCRIENPDAATIIVDIDFFKKVNDTLGHEAGDAVLKDVAATIMSIVRTTDTIRFGGEEFLLFLQDTSISAAIKVAERIRKAVQHATTVTCSVGVSNTITSADKALYNAKETGRNRVCSL